MFPKLILGVIVTSVLFNVGSFLLLRSQIKQLNATLAKASLTSTPKGDSSSASGIQQDLTEIKGQLAQIRADVRGETPVLGSDTTTDISALISQLEAESKQSPAASPTALMKVTIKDSQFKLVNMYMEKSYSAKIVANLEYGNVYGYAKKENGWYQVVLPTGLSGWVNSQYLREVSTL